MLYFSVQLLSELFILRGTCFVFFCNFCPEHSFYRERVLFSSATSVRNIHSTGSVFYFLLQLMSETFIVQGMCFVFLYNFCPKYSFYRERVLFSSTTNVRNTHSTGNVFYFSSATSVRNAHSTGNVFYFSYNLCQQYFSLQYIFIKFLSEFALKIMQVLV